MPALPSSGASRSLDQSFAPAAPDQDETATKKDDREFARLANPLAPVLILGSDGVIKHATSAARRLLQYSPDQPFDEYFFTHVHGKNLHRVMRDLAAMVKHGVERASWLLRLRTGRKRWRWYRAQALSRLDRSTPAVTVHLSNLHEW